VLVGLFVVLAGLGALGVSLAATIAIFVVGVR
jgi:hypothetical protein